MSDIVKRLRDAFGDCHCGTAPLLEAADEIELLREERNEMAQQTHSLAFMIDEIERLRAALQSLTHDPPATLDEPDTDAEVVIKMREIARRALEPKP